MVKKKATYCRICEAACGLIADVDASNQVLKLRPDMTHPVSKGFMCAKGSQFAKFSAHPKRLREPQIRGENGRFQPANWETAYEKIEQALVPILEKYGPHAIGVYYGNPMLFNSLGLVSMLRFNRVLGTRNVYSSFSQDCNNKFKAAQIIHGGELIQPIPDLEHAELGLFFGFNPAVSQGSFVHLDGGSTAFNRFKARGGQSIWVDPRESESAKRWGEHLPIHPGTDLFLMLALLNEFADAFQPQANIQGLDQLLLLAKQYPAEKTAVYTQIPPETVQKLAQRIKNAESTAFHLSVGVNMGPFGTLTYIAMQALAYLSGNFDRKGGILFSPMGQFMSWLLRMTGIGAHSAPSRIGQLTSMFDELPGGILADEILTPGDEQIRALIVIGGNPLTSIPGESKLRQAFKSLEFMVSLDLFANETAEYADVLLPTPSWLERFDLAATTMGLQKSPILQYGGPIQAKPEHTKYEWQIMSALSNKLKRPLLSSAWLTRQVAKLPLGKLTFQLLNGLLLPYRYFNKMVQGIPILTPKPGQFLKNRALHFWHDELEAELSRIKQYEAKFQALRERSGAMPMKLISRRRRLGHNSWLHNAGHDLEKETAVWLAQADLDQLGLPLGGQITIQGGTEQLTLIAKAKAGVQTGVIVMPHGTGLQNVNRLLPSGTAYIEPLSGNHWMTGLPVTVQPAVETVAGD